jgi:DNA-binding response OmpR family regulator
MRTLLLVDDDNTVALAVVGCLKRSGYAVFTAKDAVSAVAASRKSHPDILVLDIFLPTADGFEVAKLLRKLDGSVAGPIIFISASDYPALRERASKEGAAFLPKPFNATQLLHAIESCLPQHGQSKDNSWMPGVI